MQEESPTRTRARSATGGNDDWETGEEWRMEEGVRKWLRHKVRRIKTPRFLIAALFVALILWNLARLGKESGERVLEEKVTKKDPLRLAVNPTPPKRTKLKEGQADVLLERIKPLGPHVVEKTLRKRVEEQLGKGWESFLSTFQALEPLTVFLEQITQKHSKHVVMGTIGKSAEGRPIIALRLSFDKKPNSNPNVLVIGTEHGREHMVPMALCAALASMLDGSVQVEGFRGIDVLRFVNIIVIPVLNPDGYSYTFKGDAEGSEESKKMRFWRKNRQQNEDGSIGIDLNRNWGSDKFTWGHGQSWTESEVYMGAAPFAAKETAVVRDFLARKVSDARVQRAKKSGFALESLAQGFIAVHCCIGAVLQPRNYCQVHEEVERLHKLMGQEMCRQMNNVGHGRYSFKQRRKTLEISSSGISIDWAFYDAKIPYPLMIETSSSLDKLADKGEVDDEGMSVVLQRKERLRAKMSSDEGQDILPVGEELAKAILTHAALVSSLLVFTSSTETPVIAVPWGFATRETFTCRSPGKPDLVPADLCAKNKSKPWIKCNKKTHRKRRN